MYHLRSLLSSFVLLAFLSHLTIGRLIGKDELKHRQRDAVKRWTSGISAHQMHRRAASGGVRNITFSNPRARGKRNISVIDDGQVRTFPQNSLSMANLYPRWTLTSVRAGPDCYPSVPMRMRRERFVPSSTSIESYFVYFVTALLLVLPTRSARQPRRLNILDKWRSRMFFSGGSVTGERCKFAPLPGYQQ